MWVFAALAASGDLLMYQLFPWYWGNMIAGSDLLRQTARLWGVAGLSFVAFAASVTAHDVLHLWVRARKIADARLGARALWSVLGRRKLGRNSLAWPLLFLTLSFTYGTWRLLDAEPSPRTLNVAWVQPGTPPALQKYKNDDQFAAHALNAVFNVSAEAIFRSGGSIDLLLIPESSVPFLGTLESHENQNHGLYSTTYLAVIAYLARLGETDVLYNEISFEDGRLQNLATAFTRYGKRSLSYQKRHLVPFGEYLPGERWAPVLRRLFPEASAYEPGSTPRLLETSWIPGRTEKRLPVLRQSDLNVLSDARRVLSEWPASVRPTETVRIAPLICYEGLFPGLVRDSFGAAETSPDLIVNLVNDSWFGDYLENYQHALASRMRAVESGRTLVRSALSGVSGVWDPWGQRLGPELEVGAQGYAAASVPLYGGGPTPYMRWGDMPLFFVLSVITLAALLLRRRRGPPRLQ
ncbi:MAG: apolipoprotein N-acyltransferase [Spirochaetia bacterium]|nr:apolipoprotein N-acyltransferase [Spirochaetia bacterium]